jgi:hypothetical protein
MQKTEDSKKQDELPHLTANRFAPPGYVAKPESGACGCKDDGLGLNACGELCCENSPYTSTDPKDPSYYMNGGTRSIDNLCWTPDKRSAASQTIQTPSPHVKDINQFALSHEHNRPDPKDPIYTRKMASTCGPDYGLKNVTSHNKWTCHYLGKGLDEDGNWVENPFQTWSGTLPSCDHDTITITKELEHDVRKLAYYAAHGDEAKLDMNRFLCNIISVPLQ